MKNKKLLKTIAATVVCSAMGLTAFNFAACEPGNGGENGGGHKHNYTWVDDGNGSTHHQHCDVEGCDTPDKSPAHHYDIDEDNVCDRCGAALSSGEVQYDIITTSVDFNAAAKEIAGGETSSNQTVGDAGYTYGGKFFFVGGNRFEPGSSSCVNTQKKDITITLSGVTNSIKIVGKGASGTAGDVILKNSSGIVIDTDTSTGNGAPVALSGEDLPAGVYTITSGTSVRLTEITITEKLEQSEATGISVTATNVDFLFNSDFSPNGLTVVLNYANGRKDTLTSTAYEVTHNVDKTKAGKYAVTVKYKENEQFTDTYDVYYYTVDSIEKHTIGYNGKDTQYTLQQAAITGGTISNDYLTVKGTGTVEGRTHTFNLPASALNIDSVSTATAGEKTVNVSVKTDYTTNGIALACDYKVAVKDKITATNNKVEITVGETGDFKTLTQAVQYLKACNLDAAVNKVIKLQEGTYTEKVWLDLDNVTLVGLGTNIDDTKLTYSLVEGDADAINGTLWGLNCATLHVKGKNFKAYNLAIHNDFDYINNSGNYSGSQAAQGLALTLAGDGNVIYNCHLYGNQDTLYMKDGRSYFYKTQIDGNVDFIFGNNKGLAYFEECTVKAISRGKSENGHVAVPQHDEANKPDYGYIFDNCTFTDDGNVADGGMTLGRPWGKNATVAYINCSFSAAYAQKFADMSGNKPEAADFCVYNIANADGTPITGIPVGGKVLTADQASNYTKANIFGTSNGNSGYSTVFKYDEAYANLRILAGLDQGNVTVDPSVTITLKDDSTLPDKDCSAAINEKYGDKFTWTGTANFEAAKPGNGVKVGLDTVITFKVAGEVSLVVGYQGMLPSDYVITYKDGMATVKFVKTSGQYGDYIGEIIIDTSKTPEDTVEVEEGEKQYQTITSSTSAADAKIQRTNDGKLFGTDYFKVEGSWGENGGHPMFTADSKISFNVTAGANITFHSYYSNGAKYTFKAVVDGKEIVGQLKTADSADYTVSFSVESILLDADGNPVDITGVDKILIEVTATGTAYCDYITVTYPAA